MGRPNDIVDMFRMGRPLMIVLTPEKERAIRREAAIRDAVEAERFIEEMKDRIRRRDVYGDEK